MNQKDVETLVRSEVLRILPNVEINWESLGYQMDSLDRLEFVEHLGGIISVNLDILLMNPSVWSSFESLSGLISKLVAQKINDKE